MSHSAAARGRQDAEARLAGAAVSVGAAFNRGERRAHGHLYALEVADLGRGRPSMATVFGLWQRWEPRPAENVIDADLLDLCLWVAEIAPGIDPMDVARVAERAAIRRP